MSTSSFWKQKQMALPQLDPRFEEYVREHPTISYAQPDEPWLV
jgi:hypothetical protein